ncbi:uncharacterized protein G6M90_00g017890 [Metarhizium brunneum]|uniref:Uncharacterized protein n=1 Tax=Metarhizium brunneum TaxID=500148 RepID=A0A7D5YPJ0_9HYPO|nr:hypothetical protein G6M90_00g017890 [Metarhizium brunneum]
MTMLDQVTTAVSLLLLCMFLRIAWESGASARRTKIWLGALMLNAALLMTRAMQVGSLHPQYRKLLFLWAAEMLLCFVTWMWSFQPPETERWADGDAARAAPEAAVPADAKGSK